MRKFLFALALLIPSEAWAGCRIAIHGMSSLGSSQVTTFHYICDLDSEKPNATNGDTAFAINTNKFYIWSGSWIEKGGSSGGGPTIARKALDQAYTSNVFTNVTDLSFPISASTTYSFECSLSYITAATTTALQVSFNGPASPTALRYTVFMNTSATAKHSSSQSAYDTVVNPATGGGATALPVQLFGTLTNGLNAGTLALRMRTEVNASSVTIQRGSFCILY